MGSDRRPPVQNLYGLVMWLCSSDARTRRLCAVIATCLMPVTAGAVTLIVVGASASHGQLAVAGTGAASACAVAVAVVRWLLKRRTMRRG